jgi:hypothetical protein
MAKVVYSPQVGDMRNKTGGAVHTKTRFGSMVRRKVSPTQPRSSAQMNVRANFTALAKSWTSALTDELRAAWISLAQQYPVKDVFGAAHNLTGLQLYVRLNRALATIGVPPLVDPPASLSVGYPGALTLVCTGTPVTAFTVALANYNGPTEEAMVYATAPQSAGRSTAGAKFRLLDSFATGAPHPLNILPKYTEKFGAPISGRKIFVRVMFTHNVTGAQSLPSEKSVTAP